MRIGMIRTRFVTRMLTRFGRVLFAIDWLRAHRIAP